MSRRWQLAIGLALTTLAALAAARHLPIPARVLTAFLLVPLPAFMRWQARTSQEAAELVPRTGLYLSSALLLLALAALTAGVAMAGGINAAQLGFGLPTVLPFLAWTLGSYVAGLAVLALGRYLHISETPLLRQLIPVTPLEKYSFSALSLTAGFTEEFVFRGFLLWALLQATGSVTLAVAASSLVFGIMHAYQDAAGAARAAILGAVLAAPVLATGSVLPSMIAHAALDITSGLLLARWLLADRR